jgi:Tol biopolymer transport system component
MITVIRRPAGSRRVPRVALIAVAIATLSGCTFITRSDIPQSELPQSQTFGSDSVLSADGRYAAFTAYGPLVTSDTDLEADIYVHDHVADTTERISAAAGGGNPDGRSYEPSISANGRSVSFVSEASNLLASGPTPAGTNVFVRDRDAHVTELVPFTTDGKAIDGYVSSAQISADGKSVMATLGASNVGAGSRDEPHVFVHDLDSGVTEQVDRAGNGEPAAGLSEGHGISSDGNLVTFVTAALNMLPGTDGATNVFLRNRAAGTTRLVSATPAGVPGNGGSGGAGTSSMTSDGRFVLFVSIADDLTPGDTPETSDLFVRDLTTGTTERVVATKGVAAPAFIFPYGLSDDGRYVVGLGVPSFTDLQKLRPYLIDRVEQRRSYIATTPAQIPLAPFGTVPAISADGAYVSFSTGNGTFLRSTVVPTLSAALPSSAPRGATVDVTLTGTYLFANPFVSFGDGTTVTNVTVLDEHHVRVTVNVAPDAATGKRTAILQNQGTGAGTRTGGLTVLVDALEVTP